MEGLCIIRDSRGEVVVFSWNHMNTNRDLCTTFCSMKQLVQGMRTWGFSLDSPPNVSANR